MKDKSKKYDLIEMCDKLEKKKNSCNYEGEVREAKIMVESYVKNDRNKLIKLRAELEYHRNFNESTQNSLAFLVACLSLMISVFGVLDYDNRRGKLSFVLGTFAVFLVVLLVCLITHKTYRRRWMCIIEEVLKESKVGQEHEMESSEYIENEITACMEKQDKTNMEKHLPELNKLSREEMVETTGLPLLDEEKTAVQKNKNFVIRHGLLCSISFGAIGVAMY